MSLNSPSSPKSSEKSIQNHLRRYYSLLGSNVDFNLSLLFDTYRLSRPSLHKLVDSKTVDASALNYAVPRLPPCVNVVSKVIIAQSTDQLASFGIDISTWEIQSAPARRRLNYFDDTSKTLAILINSDSDIDDFINCLIAFQIERQKDPPQYRDITIRCLPLNETYPELVAADWWKKNCTNSLVFDFTKTPVYFVSSNLHSLTNLIGGYVNQRQDYIISHLEKSYSDLYDEWNKIKSGQNQLRVIDFLYYVSAKYFKDIPHEATAKSDYEESIGVKKIRINSQLPCIAQLIPISSIAKSAYKDPNLNLRHQESILNSRAYILNIEYPLGMSAYFILKQILSGLEALKGVYIIGKAAILTGDIGDIQVPNIVFDERSNNVFHPSNIFNTFFPFPAFVSSVLQNQKAISVYGTFLENQVQLQNYINSGFNVIEMESGPYLSAIHQFVNHLDKIPQNEVAYLNNLPFDLGIINYASDNPLTHSLGDGVMSLKGVEPTYLAALTTLQRIIDLESQ